MKTQALILAAAAALAGCSAARDTPEAHYQRGLEAYRAQQPRTAKVEFMNVLQADPNHRAARLMQARVLLQLGQGVQAEAEINRLRASGLPASELYHLMAHAKYLQGEHRAALAEANHAPEKHFVYAARIASRALLAQGQRDWALNALQQALERAPEDGAVWTEMARLRRATGDISEALSASDRAVRLAPRSPEALVLRGELIRAQYGLEASLQWFNRALEVDPGHVPALLERGLTYGDMGRNQAMLADARTAIALTGGHPTAYYLQAMLAARARRFDLAKSIYRRTGGALDNTPAGMLLASAIDYQTGNVNEAVQRLTRLVDRQPENRKARRLLAAAHWRKGDAAGTVAALSPIADRPDADSYTLSLLGRALLQQGDTATAAVYLARAAAPQQGARAAVIPVTDHAFAELRQQAADRPDDGPAQVRLISALLARGQGAEALARAQRLQASSPGAPEVHLLVGDALGTRGDFNGAAENYRRAANLSFTEPVAIRLVEALRRSGQVAAADGVLTLFVQQNPRNVPALLMLAGRRMEQRDWAGAIGVYEALRSRIGNRDATILNNLAWAYSESGDVERALPLARAAWSLDRDNPATADTLGWILFKSGRRAEGLALLEQAARGAPDDQAIRRNLERARQG